VGQVDRREQQQVARAPVGAAAAAAREAVDQRLDRAVDVGQLRAQLPGEPPLEQVGRVHRPEQDRLGGLAQAEVIERQRDGHRVGPRVARRLGGRERDRLRARCGAQPGAGQ
jgi:hypothetical protein